MTQKPYKIHIPNRGNLEVVVHAFKIGVIDRKRMTYLEYRNGKFLMKEVGEHVFDHRIFRIATKDNIQRAGIWDLVINKDVYPREERRNPVISMKKNTRKLVYKILVKNENILNMALYK